MRISGDYKDSIQQIAEELSQDKYQKDFFELSGKLQSLVFTEAEREYVEQTCDVTERER